MTKFLRFTDLKSRGIVGNWNTLLRWIEAGNFPQGRKLGANTRAWTEAEIEAWAKSLPLADARDNGEAA